MYQPTEKVWAATFEQSPVGIGFVGLRGEWIKANDALCELLEYSELELSKLTWQEITHPKDIDSDMSMIEKIENGTIKGFSIVKRYITKTNKVVWVRLTVSGIKNDEEKIMHYISHVQPLLNGERAKLEKIGDNHISIRPTISVGEFVADNYLWFIRSGAVIIACLVALGVAIWGTLDKIDKWDQIMKDNSILFKKDNDEK